MNKLTLNIILVISFFVYCFFKYIDSAKNFFLLRTYQDGFKYFHYGNIIIAIILSMILL